MGSDATTNLKAGAKMRALQERFPQGFDFAAIPSDRVLWGAAVHGMVVGGGRAARWLESSGKCARRFGRLPDGGRW